MICFWDLGSLIVFSPKVWEKNDAIPAERECWKELGPRTMVCYVCLEDAGFLENKMLLGTRPTELTPTPLDFSLLGFL